MSERGKSKFCAEKNGYRAAYWGRPMGRKCPTAHRGRAPEFLGLANCFEKPIGLGEFKLKSTQKFKFRVFRLGYTLFVQFCRE